LAAFNALDWVMIGLMGLSGLVGLFRGLVREVLSLLTWALAIFVAIRFSPDFARLFETILHSPTMRLVAAFALLFVVSLILAGMLGYLLTRLLELSGLSGIDRLAGLIFGVARGALILAVGVFMARTTPFPKEVQWQESRLIPVFQSLALWLEAQVPPGFVPKFGDKSFSP
jgi:membrane protein required for colicin V production